MSKLQELRLFGFDESRHIPFTKKYRVGCSCCEVLVINGIACHETGCEQAMHECNGCCNVIPVRQRYCEDCV